MASSADPLGTIVRILSVRMGEGSSRTTDKWGSSDGQVGRQSGQSAGEISVAIHGGVLIAKGSRRA
jgi:hypothetical protein